jgi:hypothetical protein
MPITWRVNVGYVPASTLRKFSAPLRRSANAKVAHRSNFLRPSCTGGKAGDAAGRQNNSVNKLWIPANVMLRPYCGYVST